MKSSFFKNLFSKERKKESKVNESDDSNELIEISEENEENENKEKEEEEIEEIKEIEQIEEKVEEVEKVEEIISSDLTESETIESDEKNLDEENKENEENEISKDEAKATKGKSFFSKIKEGLSKTRQNIISSVENVLKTFTKIDEEMFEELEEALILSDIGVRTSSDLIEKLRERVKKEKITDVADVKKLLIEEITEILEKDIDSKDSSEFNLPSPSVLLIIGVNGVGKTTSIGKLASLYKSQGKKIIIAAADTFRAAAIDQLEIWCERSGVPLVKHQENADPAAVVFDAIASAKAKKTDLLICDTAGRLQNKKNLMEELRKISRIIVRDFPDAHIETLLVLDATTGQNAVNQAQVFKEIANITGIILTKLDGTAKGGIIIPIKNELQLPVRFVGVGEKIDDLQPFDASQFAAALFD